DEELTRVAQRARLFRVLARYDDQNFEHAVHQALEKFHLLRQNRQLLQLFNEQNVKLQSLSLELETRVQKRQEQLLKMKQRLNVTNHRIEALHRALVAVHRSGSVAEMERLVNQALTHALGLSWTRILFQGQSYLAEKEALNNSHDTIFS